MSLGVRIYEDTKATSIEKDGVGVLVTTPLGRIRAGKVALATNAFKPLLKRVGHYIAPVYDYCMVTEPLSNAQLADLGWKDRQGLSDISNQFHYYRLTEDNRILWGGYDVIYYLAAARSTPSFESRPETWAKLSKHFFDTFPQLEGLKFTHAWGGVIDTCSRFCVFWGRGDAGPRGVLGRLHRARRGLHPVRCRGDARHARRPAQQGHRDRVRQDQADPVPARAVPLHRHPGHALVARPRGHHRQAQPVAARPRPLRPRLRQLTLRRLRPFARAPPRCAARA